MKNSLLKSLKVIALSCFALSFMAITNFAMASTSDDGTLPLPFDYEALSLPLQINNLLLM